MRNSSSPSEARGRSKRQLIRSRPQKSKTCCKPSCRFSVSPATQRNHCRLAGKRMPSAKSPFSTFSLRTNQSSLMLRKPSHPYRKIIKKAAVLQQSWRLKSRLAVERTRSSGKWCFDPNEGLGTSLSLTTNLCQICNYGSNFSPPTT